MKEVTLKFTNDKARYIACTLRDRYEQDERTILAHLCKIAVLREVAAQSRVEAEEALATLD